MRLQRLTVAAVFLSGLCIAGSYADASSETPQPAWQIGYWLWQMDGDRSTPEERERVVDQLYVQVGTLWSPADDFGRGRPWSGGNFGRTGKFPANPPAVKLVEDARWPEKLPKANTYIAVWRNTSSLPPGADLVPALVGQYQALKAQAAQAGQRLVGLQLDYDCPTSALDEYARFLKSLHEGLPKEDLISITALLDWFRPGTAIADTLRWVDEYIPQFYDADPAWTVQAAVSIAKPIDGTKWAAIFDSYERPYRIGIATFGRIARVKPQLSQEWEKAFFRDLSPLDVTSTKELSQVTERRNDAQEIVVRYAVQQPVVIAGHPLSAGELIELILPTQESVRTAYLAAKALGGFCTGVVFFRWPQNNEALTLTPAEVEDIISGKTLMSRPTELDTEDGECAAVDCTDLYLRLGNRYPAQQIMLWIEASAELEYILPAERIQARMQGPRTLELRLPAYVGVPRLYLGRAVTRERTQFTLRVKP